MHQRLSASYIDELPLGRSKRWFNQQGVARAALGGWQLSAVIALETGLPNHMVGTATAAAIAKVATPERQFQFGLHLAF